MTKAILGETSNGTYRKATHSENLSRIYNEHVDTIVRDCSKKSNPDYETWKYDGIFS